MIKHLSGKWITWYSRWRPPETVKKSLYGNTHSINYSNEHEWQRFCAIIGDMRSKFKW